MRYNEFKVMRFLEEAILKHNDTAVEECFRRPRIEEVGDTLEIYGRTVLDLGPVILHDVPSHVFTDGDIELPEILRDTRFTMEADMEAADLSNSAVPYRFDFQTGTLTYNPPNSGQLDPAWIGSYMRLTPASGEIVELELYETPESVYEWVATQLSAAFSVAPLNVHFDPETLR